MRYLIDSHTFLWFSAGSSELSTTARTLIENKENEIYISIASLWEISIKTALYKLEIAGTYASVIDDVVENEIEILPVNFAHTVQQNLMPFHHKDPFDRILLAQAIEEKFDIISRDEIFDIYLNGKQVKRIW